MKRKNYSTGARWEERVGYSRAVKMGNIIEISGTTAVKDGVVLHKGDAYGQARYIIEIASHVLKEAGASLENVTRTRIYVTSIEDWEAVGKAHGEFFGDIKPATSLIEISRLVDPTMLVEIEFTAIVE